MEWAWRERSPGPLLRASRPTSMALILFFSFFFVNVCVCSFRFAKEHAGCVKVTAKRAPECLFMHICMHAGHVY